MAWSLSWMPVMEEHSCASKADNDITERKATVVPIKIKYV